MANVLADFTKRREFLACIDSDGCVMDTVRVKHMDVLCPELIRTFALEAYADLVTDQGQPHSITMFLLPEGTTVGSRLKLEDFQWELLEQ